MRLEQLDDTTGGYCGMLNGYMYYPIISSNVKFTTDDSYIPYVVSGALVGVGATAGMVIAMGNVAPAASI